ncbi:penicillin acylase family protein [Methylotuvimicrobium sp. KM1]|uniref:penicillin acylase family protein n=1 Tax=Methylotuvimicrobium sp. KM1 TaxID=3377707 RepID=UPI0038502D7A
MKKIRSIVLYLTAFASLTVLIGLGGTYWLLQESMPKLNGEVELAGLVEPVTVDSDEFGIPTVHAENRLDAIRALGYLSARDRLFQMDLMRRKTAGRLAEIFGEIAVDSDTRARTLGFNRVAQKAITQLPQRHKRLLDAYAEGVNSYIEQANTLTFEFSVLNYHPSPWQAEDSILVMLGMFDTLTGWAEREERMLTVMEKTLPPDLLAFLTPDTDQFTEHLQDYRESSRPARPIPLASMKAALDQHSSDALRVAGAVQLHDTLPGSNAWTVSGKKTQDGRAILANDMHLGITVPNLWYRIEVYYTETHASGVMLPGVPIIIAGSNKHLAWGATNLSGDFLDLVSLEINPENSNEYRVDGGWQRFEQRHEIIAVKGGDSRDITVKQTEWGPVASEPLMDNLVAVRWTALDPKAINIELIDLEQNRTLEEAIPTINQSGGPQLNFLLADKTGRIAWTLMGRIPKRYGNDGSVSRSWADGSAGWNGYLNPESLPRTIDPPEGILVSANDRRFSKDYPHIIGRQFANGYRAYRITERLGQIEILNEQTMFALQLDSKSEFYQFYQQLALSVLTPKNFEQEPELAELRGYLQAWDGNADRDSLGFGLLVEFRKQLAKSVFEPFLSACRKSDRNFNYSWTYIDTPLQRILTEKPVELLPDPARFQDWDAFILNQLKEGFSRLKNLHPEASFPELTWGKINRAQYRHPFSRVLPWVGRFLDMPTDPLSGCPYCVRVAGPDFGASERLVVSPRHIDEGILHMPGGQSSHPLSPHYRDQQTYWVEGLPIPLQAGKTEHRLILQPRRDGERLGVNSE